MIEALIFRMISGEKFCFYTQVKNQTQQNTQGRIRKSYQERLFLKSKELFAYIQIHQKTISYTHYFQTLRMETSFEAQIQPFLQPLIARIDALQKHNAELTADLTKVKTTLEELRSVKPAQHPTTTPKPLPKDNKRPETVKPDRPETAKPQTNTLHKPDTHNKTEAANHKPTDQASHSKPVDPKVEKPKPGVKPTANQDSTSKVTKPEPKPVISPATQANKNMVSPRPPTKDDKKDTKKETKAVQREPAKSQLHRPSTAADKKPQPAVSKALMGGKPTNPPATAEKKEQKPAATAADSNSETVPSANVQQTESVTPATNNDESTAKQGAEPKTEEKVSEGENTTVSQQPVSIAEPKQEQVAEAGNAANAQEEDETI